MSHYYTLVPLKLDQPTPENVGIKLSRQIRNGLLFCEDHPQCGCWTPNECTKTKSLQQLPCVYYRIGECLELCDGCK
jgi:hypothetical protein